MGATISLTSHFSPILIRDSKIRFFGIFPFVFPICFLIEIWVWGTIFFYRITVGATTFSLEVNVGAAIALCFDWYRLWFEFRKSFMIFFDLCTCIWSQCGSAIISLRLDWLSILIQDSQIRFIFYVIYVVVGVGAPNFLCWTCVGARISLSSD